MLTQCPGEIYSNCVPFLINTWHWGYIISLWVKLSYVIIGLHRFKKLVNWKFIVLIALNFPNSRDKEKKITIRVEVLSPGPLFNKAEKRAKGKGWQGWCQFLPRLLFPPPKQGILLLGKNHMLDTKLTASQILPCLVFATALQNHYYHCHFHVTEE